MVDRPHSEQFDDIYFAAENGLEESRYVFLEQNHLPEAWQDKSRFVICETGFGTGLNFLCAWTKFESTSTPSQQLHYYSFEKYPLSPQEIEKYLGHWSTEFSGRLEKLLSAYPLRVGGWHTFRVSSQVTLTLIFDDVNRALPELETQVDCWFLDGHAPAKNPDMWSETVFQNMGRLSHSGTRCATFTAAGLVKRGLESAGFEIAKAKGFGRKRDMIVGKFCRNTAHTAWSLTHPQKIAIIGGGIAGASLVHALSPSIPEITLFEKTALAAGGSGNIRGLCNPRIASLRGPDADFYSPAFALAYKTFSDISHHHDIGFQPCGSLHLITDDQKEKRFNGFIHQWGWHPHHARILNVADASHVAGTPLSHAALYLPDAAMVSPKLVTSHLARPAQLVLKDILSIEQSGTGWIVDNTYFESVILTGGVDVLKFFETSQLPLQKVRGQITHVKTSPAYNTLKTNLCYGGYSSIAIGGEAVIGSTFQHWMDTNTIRPEDNNDNLDKLKNVAPHLVEDLQVIGARASFRCSAKDRFPVIGRLKNAENLYISTAHGSHGIISSLMGAQYLATQILNTAPLLPASTQKALSPSRFLK